MTSYEITIRYTDRPEAQTVRLDGLDREQAEDYTAQLRADVEEAKAVNAPDTYMFEADTAGPSLSLEPHLIRSIDLEEAEDADDAE
jgi:hypothetical protein